MNKLKEKYCEGNPQRFEDFKLTERQFGTDIDALQRSPILRLLFNCLTQYK